MTMLHPNPKILWILLAICLATVILLVPKLRSKTDEVGQIKKYVPVEAFEGIDVVVSKQTDFAKYPQRKWFLRFSSIKKDILLKAGFKSLDRDELEYVQKVFTKEFPQAFSAESDDYLLGKETDRFDVQVICKPFKRECFVLVLRH